MFSLPSRPQVEPHQHPDDPRYSSAEYRQFDPWPYLELLWSRRLIVLGVTLTAAVVATLATLRIPRQYVAEATVFLTPPTYATTLRPDALSVEAYARLAETGHVLSLVGAELQRRHPDLFGGPGEADPGGGVSYHARLSASREPQKPYLPLIGLTATAAAPERARAAANTWADVFIGEERRLSAVGMSNSANFILQEHPKAEKVLADSENALQDLLSRQTAELAALRTEVAISLKTAQLDSYEWMVVQQEDALATARATRDRLRPTVAQLEAELKATPQFLTISKAIGDEALLSASARNGTAGESGGATLQTQEVNPVHVSLSQRLAEERVTLSALTPQIESLEKQIQASLRMARDVRRALLDGERRIAEMERRHTLAAASFERSVAIARASLDKLSVKVGEAMLAQSEPGQDLKLGAYAGLPSSPSGSRRTLIIVAATLTAFAVSIVGILALGLVLGHRRDLQRTAREIPAARL